MYQNRDWEWGCQKPAADFQGRNDQTLDYSEVMRRICKAAGEW